MALVLLLCPSWATSCYRSAPTRLLTYRSLQGVGHASKQSDIKRHGRHKYIRKHTQTQLSLSSEQHADISPFITVPVCVCVMVALLLVGYVVFGHDFSSWKPIIRQHRMLPRKDEVKGWRRVTCLLSGFHKHDGEC